MDAHHNRMPRKPVTDGAQGVRDYGEHMHWLQYQKSKNMDDYHYQ